MIRRLWLAAILAAGMAVLAFFLRDIIQQAVIIPLARFFWQVGLIYRAIPQIVYWAVVLVFLVYLAVAGLSVRSGSGGKAPDAGHRRSGDIQQMVFWLQRSRKGVYSRWQVANSLANIALDILRQRDGSRHRNQPLEGPGWSPPEDVQAYLLAALQTTYADYPRRGILSRKRPTPLDCDPERVVSYLESCLEDEHEHHHS